MMPQRFHHCKLFRFLHGLHSKLADDRAFGKTPRKTKPFWLEKEKNDMGRPCSPYPSALQINQSKSKHINEMT